MSFHFSKSVAIRVFDLEEVSHDTIRLAVELWNNEVEWWKAHRILEGHMRVHITREQYEALGAFLACPEAAPA